MFLEHEIEALALLLPLALVLLLSKLLQMGCKKIKLPQVVGMLLAGIIIGFLKPIHIGDWQFLGEDAVEGLKFLAKIGVVLIMFSAGLETNIKSIKQSGLSAILVTAMGVILPMAFGFLVVASFNKFDFGTMQICMDKGCVLYEAKQSCIDNAHNILQVSKAYSYLFYGVILTATSVSVTVATLKELKRLSGKAGTIIVSAAILDDIIGVVVLSVILSLSGSSSSSNTMGSLLCNLMNAGSILGVILDVILFFIFTIAVGVAVHYIFKLLNKKKAHKRRVPIFAIAFAFFMAWASETLFGIADITGAYFAGLALAGIGRHINPVKDPLSDDTTDYIERKSDVLSYMLFSPIFFANVGISTNFGALKVELIGLGICFILAGLLGKVLGCGFGAKVTGNSWKDSLRIGIGMMARAEVALICAQKGIDAGLVNPAMSTFIVIMIIISSFVTPLVLKATYKNEAPMKEDYEAEKFSSIHEPSAPIYNEGVVAEAHDNVEP